MFTFVNTVMISKARRAISHLYALGLILTLALAAQAQGVGSSRGLASGGGIHTIQGRIYFPSSEAMVSKSVKVSLESTTSFGSMSTVTDPDGSFRFRSLEAGAYTVVIDAGREYEIYRETVNIDREASPGGRIIQVNVQLRLKADASNPAFAGVPQSALDLYQKGTAAAQKGNPKGAVEFLSKAVAIYPNFTQALTDLGVQYLKLGQMDKAAQTFEALVKLKPNDPVSRLNLGIALFNQKKLEDAEAHLREALKLNAAGPTAHYYLGLTLVSLKRYPEAQKELELAISNGGENLALAHKYLGGLYMSAHRKKEAADELEKYLQLDPKAPEAERIRTTIKELRN
jgi:Tfp pilus assembly protein PilF